MKPRLLIIHNRLVVGGPALDIIPLAYHLRNEFDIHILYGRKEADETEPSFMLEKYQGLTLIKNKWMQRSPNPWKDYLAYRFIKKHIASFQPHIVHTHGAKVGLFGRLAAHKAGVPLVIHTFHGHFFHSYFNRAFSKLLVQIERRLARITHHIIAISQKQKEELRKILRITDEDRIKLIPLGVDYIDQAMHEHYKQAFKRTYRVGENMICIGLLGRLVGIKNPKFFIDVVDYVLKSPVGSRVKFIIAGDGYEKPRMQRCLAEKKIGFTGSLHEEAPVVFTSWVQNIQNILEGLDVVVLTSYNEGTPMSLIEAQLCGKPVVAVDVGGVKDTMVSGETGFLIPRHDLVEFSEALIRLVTDSDLRNEMGKKARTFASSSFSKQKELENFRELYRSYNSV